MVGRGLRRRVVAARAIVATDGGGALVCGTLFSRPGPDRRGHARLCCEWVPDPARQDGSAGATGGSSARRIAISMSANVFDAGATLVDLQASPDTGCKAVQAPYDRRQSHLASSPPPH